MWTRGTKNENGKFSYTVWNVQNEVIAHGECDTAQEADRAAEQAQRAVFFPPVQNDGPEMSIEEILAELEAW